MAFNDHYLDALNDDGFTDYTDQFKFEAICNTLRLFLQCLHHFFSGLTADWIYLNERKKLMSPVHLICNFKLI